MTGVRCCVDFITIILKESVIIIYNNITLYSTKTKYTIKEKR
jgi:hypothetical protein